MKTKKTKFPRPELTRITIQLLLAAVPEPEKPDNLHCVARLTGLRLDGIDFTGMNLANVDFSHSSMRGCKFRNTKLYGSNFDHADLSGSDFRGCHMDSVLTDRDPIYFSNANFTGANLNGVSLVGNQLEDVNFTNADLRGADLSSIDGLGAIFTDAMLEGAIFIDATLAPKCFDSAKPSVIVIGKSSNGAGAHSKVGRGSK